MSNIDIASLIQMRQNKFIESRTIIEAEVNKFINSLTDLDESVKQKFGFDLTGKTARDLLPELWSDNFNMDTYNAQLNNFNNYVAVVKNICDVMNQEALNVLSN